VLTYSRQVPEPGRNGEPEPISAEGARLLAALLNIDPDDAARLRDGMPLRRRPPGQTGPTGDWGEGARSGDRGEDA
jgi:hypothetical protein